jgi:hypothetical protein
VPFLLKFRVPQAQLTEWFMLSREVRFAAHLLVPFVACGLLFLTGCPGETPQAKNTATVKPHGDADDHDELDGHGHHHHHAEHGPHGGALAAIGDDDAHLEFVLDAESGKLTAYALDGEAEKPVSIKQSKLQLTYTLTKLRDIEEGSDDIPDDTFTLSLDAVSPADDGTAAEFAGQADTLKGCEKFSAVLTTVNVGGKSFQNVTFKYPEGNEEHDH